MNENKCLITGSLAYDRIAVFQDHFKNHILPDKIHQLNVAFMVNKMTIQRGGTGGNIAYSLALLGQEPLLAGTAGSDFKDYLAHLDHHKIDTRYVKVMDDQLTAHATIITDLSDNQITAFYPGAMNHAHEVDLRQMQEPIALAIISPNGIQAMNEYPRVFREQKIPFIADPGQAIPALSADDLANLIDGAAGLIVNDYEWQMVSDKTGWSEPDVLERAGWLIVTLGEKGVKLITKEETLEIPAVPAKTVVDPTGCGDAFRAGLMYGIKAGRPLKQAAQIGVWIAAKVAEKAGTQNHHLTPEERQVFLNQL